MIEAGKQQKQELRDDAYFLFRYLLHANPEAACMLPYSQTDRPVIFCPPACLRNPSFQNQPAAVLGYVNNILSGTIYDNGNLLFDMTLQSYKEFQTGIEKKRVKNKQKGKIKPEPGADPSTAPKEPDFIIIEEPIIEEFLTTEQVGKQTLIIGDTLVSTMLNSVPDNLKSQSGQTLIESLKVDPVEIKRNLLYAGINQEGIRSLPAKVKNRLRLDRYVLETAWLGLTRNSTTQNLFRGNYKNFLRKKDRNPKIYDYIEDLANKTGELSLSAHQIKLLLTHISGFQLERNPKTRSVSWKINSDKLIDFWNYFEISNPVISNGQSIDLDNKAALSQVISSLMTKAKCVEIDKTKMDFIFVDRSKIYGKPKGQKSTSEGLLGKLKDVLTQEELPCYECPLIDYGACARGKEVVEKNKKNPKEKRQFPDTYQTKIMDWMDKLGANIKVLLPGGRIISINAVSGQITLDNGRKLPLQNLAEFYPKAEPLQTVDNRSIQLYDGERIISEEPKVGKAFDGFISDGKKRGLKLDRIPGYESFGHFIKEVNPNGSLGREFMALDPNPNNTYFIKKTPSPGTYIVTELSPDNVARTYEIYET